MKQHKLLSNLLFKRFFLFKIFAVIILVFLSSACGDEGNNSSSANYAAIGEEHSHLATYMAFASDLDGIWEEDSPDNAGLERVRSDLIDVAKAIGTYERVKMLVLSSEERDIAQEFIDEASSSNPDIHSNYIGRPAGIGGIELIIDEDGFNDYWTRDTAPVFVKNTSNNELTAINFNFNGWGNANSQSDEAPANSNRTKIASFYQAFENDQKVANSIAERENAPVINSTLTLEGGAIETDGEGTAILTASSVLHPNRNPQLFDVTKSGNQIISASLKSDAKTIVEAELRRTLGVTKVIWLTGTKSFPFSSISEETDITNGHVDFYAKFLAPGIVAYASDPNDSTGEKLITETHRTELLGKKDAKDRLLRLVEFKVPTTYGRGLTNSQKANFAAGYINFYFCENAIIIPKFGDANADLAIINAIAPYKGARKIVQVDITGIASGGGGLHCATSQVPSLD